MLKKRLIAVIILRDGRVVQSVKFKHTNVIHYDAFHAVEAFNRWAVDEIVFLNVSKEKSTQNDFLKIVEHVSKTCFVPLSVGGWIDSEEYATKLIQNGADKLIINTISHTNPQLVRDLSKRFGVQCIIGSMDVIHQDGVASVAVDRGLKIIGVSPEQWALNLVEMGCGEIFFNSIDFDGNRRGYDKENLTKVVKAVQVPVIAFGGVFMWKHLAEGLDCGADAVAAANIFHYKEQATKQAKKFLSTKGYKIRAEGQVNYEVL